MNADQKLVEFQKLDYEKKKEMCLNILTVLEQKGNEQAGRILAMTQKMTTIPDNLLISIFKDFETSIDKIKEGKVQDKLYMFQKSKEFMAQLRAKEKAEREAENPEDLLKEI